MLDTADVLVDRKPVVGAVGVEGSLIVVRVGIAVEVPAGVDEGIHGVGLAFRGSVATWTCGVDELRDAAKRAAAFLGDMDLLGQKDWKRGLFHRDGLIWRAVAVDHRDGGSPVALAADTPVLEPIGDGGFAEALCLGEGGHLALGLEAGFAGPLAGIDQDAFLFCEVRESEVVGVEVRGDDAADGEVVLGCEVEVALVVGGHAHDGAGAVVGEDVVGDPDGDLLAGEGVGGATACRDAVLLDGTEVAGLAGGGLLGDHLLDCGGEFHVKAGPVLDQRMFGGELEGGGAEDGVDAGGEDGDAHRVGAVVDGEGDLRAFAAADPVALHGAHLLGPAVEGVEAGEEFVGVAGDAEEPLRQVALLDQGVFVPPAAAVHDLLIGEHGAADWAPVDLALLAVGEAGPEHLEEEPLVPAVVVGQTGGDLARPVEAHAKTAELLLHGGDVRQRPLARGDVVFKRGVLGGEAEGVPAHGVQDVRAAHPHEAGERVADGVVADVADVELTAGIRQHLQAVVLRLAGGRVFGGVEGRIGVPAGLPSGFDLSRIVALGVLARLYWVGHLFHCKERY